MVDRIEIMQLSSLPSDLEVLRAEAARLGFAFMDRLVSDWMSGANTFNQPGECFLGARSDSGLVGVGGLNRDPYSSRADVGRIRHVYVGKDWRRRGIGRALVDRLMSDAQKVFSEVRLRTATEGAAVFYVRCGFCPTANATASHRLKFEGRK